jgi:ankyrin repeat protein
LRGRVVAKEQEEIFAAINFEEGQAVELDEVERTFARAFHLSLYALLGLLIAGIAAYAVNRGIDARRAAEVVPLQQAAVEGRLDVLRALIAEGAPVNGIGPEGGTPLASAIRADQAESVRLLLDGGAEPSDSALQLAMRYERWEIFASLIEAGGNPEVRGEWDGRSPLELATERRDLAMIRLLLEHGADPGAISHAGPMAQPALHHAAEQGMQDVVELLLVHGADPSREWMGFLPRDLAAAAGHQRVAELLAQAGR